MSLLLLFSKAPSQSAPGSSNVSQHFSLFVQGNQDVSNNVVLTTDGNTNVFATVPLYISASTLANGSIPYFIRGFNYNTAPLSLFTVATNSAFENIPLFIDNDMLSTDEAITLYLQSLSAIPINTTVNLDVYLMKVFNIIAKRLRKRGC